MATQADKQQLLDDIDSIRLRVDSFVVGEPTEPTVGPVSFFDSLASMPECLLSFAYDSQDGINARTVNVSRGADPINNDSVIYDPVMKAARLEVSGSLPLVDRTRLDFPERILSGHLACVWDYFPADDWDKNQSSINTHKMFMLANRKTTEGRLLEQRFMYNVDGTNDGRWMIDVRPYGVNAATDGEGAGLGRITPHTPVFAPVGQWVRFYAQVDCTGPVPTYTLQMRTSDGEFVTIYNAIPLPNFADVGGVEFFDPTWCNTSQAQDVERNLTHGWLRNVAVLWSENHIDQIEAITQQPVTE